MEVLQGVQALKLWGQPIVVVLYFQMLQIDWIRKNTNQNLLPLYFGKFFWIIK